MTARDAELVAIRKFIADGGMERCPPRYAAASIAAPTAKYEQARLQRMLAGEEARRAGWLPCGAGGGGGPSLIIALTSAGRNYSGAAWIAVRQPKCADRSL